MKRTLAVIAIAAIGLAACQNNFEEAGNADVKNNITVKFVAESAESRTAVDTVGETPLFSWNENETFAVLEQTDALAQATAVTYEKVDCKAVINAEFAANEGKEAYSYVAVYPKGGYVAAENINAATLALPATQTMVEGSYDPNADLMVSMPIATTAQPTEAQSLRFTRLAAVAKMSIKNLTLETDEVVERVEFTAEGKTLAGNITADLANPHEFNSGEGSSCVTVATASAGDVYFTVLPTTLEAGDAYTITVVTNKHLFVKTSAIPEGKSIVFEAGMVSRVSVNMSGVAPSEKWVLVRDASTLKQGDIVAIAAKNYNYVMGKQGQNYPVAAKVEAIKIGDHLYHPITTAVDNMIQPFTLAKRDNERTAFDFYNGVDYLGDISVGFLYATGNNYSPKLQAYCNNSTLFDVAIENGIASITANKIEKSYKYLRFSYSTSISSCKFDMTSTELTNENNMLCIYKLEGGVGVIPVVAANVTVPDNDEKVVIAEEGAQSATAIEEVVFNYVGDWTISVSDDAEWIDFAYDQVKNCITYTAQANTGAVRETSATITASMEGQDDLTWTFNILQKGAPQEITIAEFMNKGQDVNVTYKLTGRITEMTSSSSGTYKITDGTNVATITYLYTDSNEKVYDSNIDLKVGDVVTVTTVVTSTTKGKGGSSSCPSIYKGHYTIEATASSAVGFSGGDATINVAIAKFGHIVAPTAISDNSNITTDNNPVSAYSFTDNGNGTATAIVSFGENTTGGSRKVDLTFSAGSPLAVSTSITIMQDVNPALKTGWWLVTDVNDLVAGDKIIIAATGLDYAISTETNTNTRKSKPITKVGAALENVADNIQQYALEIDANGLYSFKGTIGSDANKYIYAASSSSNYMKVNTSLDDNGKFTVAIDSDGAATVIAQGSNTRKYMQYNNKSTSSPAFYCTDGSLGAVCLYKYYN